MKIAFSFLVVATLCGCASLSGRSNRWHGHTEGRIKVRVDSTADVLPDAGWLVESERVNAAGHLSFIKWGAGDYKYKKKAYYQVMAKWNSDAAYLGRFESRDGVNEFCAVNPELGAEVDGNSFVITHAYDYCAPLIRQ